MSWWRYNESSSVFEVSADNGVSWSPPSLDGAIITYGSVPGARLSEAWPVGSIFISTLPTNPQDQLGFGAWEAFGTGRILVGL